MKGNSRPELSGTMEIPKVINFFPSVRTNLYFFTPLPEVYLKSTPIKGGELSVCENSFFKVGYLKLSSYSAFKITDPGSWGSAIILGSVICPAFQTSRLIPSSISLMPRVWRAGQITDPRIIADPQD